MNVYYSTDHLLHQPPFEIFDGGDKIPNFEVPERAERILAALSSSTWAHIQAPADFGLEPILAVHNRGYIEFLRSAFAEWQAQPTEDGTEKIALLPASFPPGRWRRTPKSLLGRAGLYMADLAAPITGGTWQAALSSANCALAGISDLLHGAKSAFALCRPPGHHAGKDYCAGYCYINNSAVAANQLSAYGKIAILDIDYHAGNGTQDIFYHRSDVLSISIHADPDFEYPYFAGCADETGEGAGQGFHHNFPLPAGTDSQAYLRTLHIALDLIRSYDPRFLVVSAGMDLFAGDPLGKFAVSTAGIRQIGHEIASLGLPSLVVMEGGYNNAALGENMVALLENFADR
jgi:acetoin utilization deacetylase AcuC-like enzyme